MNQKSTIPAESGTPVVTRRWSRIRDAAQIVISLSIAVATLVFLAIGVEFGNHEEGSSVAQPAEVVQLDSHGRIQILPDSTLEKKLQVVTLQEKTINSPVTTVNGTVVASYRGSGEAAKDSLQFESADLLTAYTDWQKAVADVTFLNTQLTAVRELAETRISKQDKIVARLTRLVEAGTDTTKDLDAAKTDLLEAKITGRKEIHVAETDVRNAVRSESSLARQLRQAGLDPELLQSMTVEDDLVVAGVPEARMHLVHQGQKCEARFVALAGEVLTGTVTSISPVITKDRRTLRVLFTLKDPEDKLRPGMFAEIGLGTDAHQELVVPFDGVLHVGRIDYLIKEFQPNVWEVAEVQIGELRGTDVQILSGVKPGERVIGMGAILLKPVVIRSLNLPTTVAKNSEGRLDAQHGERP